MIYKKNNNYKKMERTKHDIYLSHINFLLLTQTLLARYTYINHKFDNIENEEDIIRFKNNIKKINWHILNSNHLFADFIKELKRECIIDLGTSKYLGATVYDVVYTIDEINYEIGINMIKIRKYLISDKVAIKNKLIILDDFKELNIL